MTGRDSLSCVPPSPSFGNDEMSTCAPTLLPPTQDNAFLPCQLETMTPKKDYVEAEAEMRKSLMTLKKAMRSLLEEGMRAGRALAAVESLCPLPTGDIPQGIHLPAPRRKRGQQIPHIGSGGSYSPEEKKTRKRRERVEGKEIRLWPSFQRAPAAPPLEGQHCMLSLSKIDGQELCPRSRI